MPASRFFQTVFLGGVAIVLTLFFPKTGMAQTQGCSAPASDETTEDLDRLYALHDYVFAARVDRVVRRGVLADAEVPEEAELFVYLPTLKGTVPEKLLFDRNEPCAAEFTEGAVYLLFLNDLEDTPFRSEVRLMLASERGPAVPWLFEWLEARSKQPPVATASTPSLRDSKDLRWTYRLLLLDATIDAEALASLSSVRRELRERDVLWFVLGDNGLDSNYVGDVAPALQAELVARLRNSNAAVALIGKDGGLKLRADVLDIEDVFARIDSMPMRIREMRVPGQ
ncbi:MAG: DUF4174 domain-containing protein [Pseudomonadota bacterium]